MGDYANVLARLRTLNKNVQSLIDRNDDLKYSNDKLRKELETVMENWKAERRVFEKQLRKENSSASEEKKA